MREIARGPLVGSDGLGALAALTRGTTACREDRRAVAGPLGPPGLVRSATTLPGTDVLECLVLSFRPFPEGLEGLFTPT